MRNMNTYERPYGNIYSKPVVNETWRPRWVRKSPLSNKAMRPSARMNHDTVADQHDPTFYNPRTCAKCGKQYHSESWRQGITWFLCHNCGEESIRQKAREVFEHEAQHGMSQRT